MDDRKIMYILFAIIVLLIGTSIFLVFSCTCNCPNNKLLNSSDMKNYIQCVMSTLSKKYTLLTILQNETGSNSSEYIKDRNDALFLCLS